MRAHPKQRGWSCNSKMKKYDLSLDFLADMTDDIPITHSAWPLTHSQKSRYKNIPRNAEAQRVTETNTALMKNVVVSVVMFSVPLDTPFFVYLLIKRSWHVTLGKTQVQIIKVIMAEFDVMVLHTLAHCHTTFCLLRPLNITRPTLIFLVTPVLFKMSVVKKTY